MSQKVSFSFLPILFGLASSHAFGSAAKKSRTKVIETYCQIKLNDFKQGTPLKDIFWKLPEDIRNNIVYLTKETPFVLHWGLFGSKPNQELVKDLEELYKKIATENLDSFEYGKNLHNIFKELDRKKDYWKGLEASSHEEVYNYLSDNGLQLFPINGKATGFTRLSSLLLQLANAGFPKIKGEKEFSSAHFINLINVFLLCEISTEKQLLKEILDCYLNEFTDYLPWSIFLQKMHGLYYGADLEINLTKWGWLLGYQGSKSQLYKYQVRYSKKLQHKLCPSYDFYLNQICAVQESEEDSLIYKSDDKEIKKPHSYKYFEPIRLTTKDEEKVFGYLLGYFITKGNPPDVISMETKNNLFYLNDDLIQIYYLEPNTFYNDRTFRHSTFTQLNHQKRAYKDLIKENAITKRRPVPRKDTRWFNHFEEYLESIDSIPMLRHLLKSDDKLKEKISSELKLEDGEYEGYLEYWEYLLTSKVNPKFEPVKVAKDLNTGRTINIASPNHKAFEKVCNHLLQVIIQKINLDYFDGSLSNFLPGCASFLQSGDRIKKAIKGREISLCNLDVKKCFDSVNLNHPNFMSCLNQSLILVEQLLGKKESDFIRLVLVDYLYENLIVKKAFTFDTDSKCTPPKFGSLPTGFVLSPILWYVLALPACYNLSLEKKKGTIIDWDLCGDDLLVIAPQFPSMEDKEKVAKPFFDLATHLSLKFHFWKNYKENHCFYPMNKFEPLFKNNEQVFTSAWIDHFPKFSIPIYHAGVCVTGNGYIEVVNTISMVQEKMKENLYRKMSFIKHHGSNSFVPKLLVDSFLASSLDFGYLNNPSKNEVNQKPVEKRLSNLRTILFGNRIPLGRRLDSTFNIPSKSIKNDTINSVICQEITDDYIIDSTKEFNSVPTKSFFIFNRENQRKALEEKPLQLPVIKEEKTDIEILKEKIDFHYASYVESKYRLKSAKSSDLVKKCTKNINEHLYYYCCLGLKYLELNNDESHISSYKVTSNENFYCVEDYQLKFNVLEEFCYLLDIDDLGRPSNTADITKGLLHGRRNFLDYCYNDFTRIRANKLVPYAFLLESKKEPSYNVQRLVNSFKRGITLIPDISLIYDSKTKKYKTKQSLTQFTGEYKSIAHKLIAALDKKSFKELDDEEKEAVVEGIKKTKALAKKMVKNKHFIKDKEIYSMIRGVEEEYIESN